MEENILIIEDDKFLRELISRKLIGEGFKVDEAIDGEEGLSKIKETKPDLVLLDLILPGLDGFEVLERLKDNPSTASVPVLVLSNLGQKDEIERGLSLGAVDFLVKAHFTPEEIVAKMKEILPKKKR
jgi:DNA-binding response OmpR family regulator